jgi:hypothetical protein
MKSNIIKVVLISFFMIGLWAMDLPLPINQTENVSCVYAFGRRPGQTPGQGSTRNVPEPSILILLGGGAAGVFAYRFIKNNRNKSK